MTSSNGKPGLRSRDRYTASLLVMVRNWFATGMPWTRIRSGATPCAMSVLRVASLGVMYMSTWLCAQYRCATKSVSTPTSAGRRFPVRCFQEASTPQANACVQTTTSGSNARKIFSSFREFPRFKSSRIMAVRSLNFGLSYIHSQISGAVFSAAR